MSGTAITIHLLERTVDGLLTAEIDNWVGKVIVAPRSDLLKLLSLPELKGLGIYILISEDPDAIGKKVIYVGQGIVADRLGLHARDSEKDYWDEKTVVMIASDSSLNTAHCLYLESRLIDAAKRTQVATLKNSQFPGLPHVSAPDKARAENFLTQTYVLLPVLGINYFVPPPQAIPATQALITSQGSGTSQAAILSDFTLFEFVTKEAKAEMQIVNNKYVLVQGSTISPSETKSIGKAYSTIRSQLRTAGKLIDDPQSQSWRLTQDEAFNSPSAAAQVVCGYSIAGTIAWKVKGTQQTYSDWQQAQLSSGMITPTMPTSNNGNISTPPM